MLKKNFLKEKLENKQLTIATWNIIYFINESKYIISDLPKLRVVV